MQKKTTMKKKTKRFDKGGLLTQAKKMYNQTLDDYEAAAKANPGTKLAADLTPFVGAGTSVADAAVDFRAGRNKEAVVDMLGVIPYFKAARTVLPMGKELVAATRTGAVKEALSRLARLGDTVGDVSDATRNKGFKRGGRVKSTSKRGDGIAQRGKTKGRFV
jgi:hypothetical protein